MKFWVVCWVDEGKYYVVTEDSNIVIGEDGSNLVRERLKKAMVFLTEKEANDFLAAELAAGYPDSIVVELET